MDLRGMDFRGVLQSPSRRRVRREHDQSEDERDEEWAKTEWHLLLFVRKERILLSNLGRNRR
jgi:hypothetical protein